MTYTYIAKSGITVTTPDPYVDDDFPTVLHYLLWSYSHSIRRMLRTEKQADAAAARRSSSPRTETS